MDERLKLLRSKLGLNQRDFCKKTKIAHSTLAMFETGQRTPKEIHISQICQTFSVNEDWLCTGDGEIFTNKSIGTINQLANEYNMDDLEVSFISCYLNLEPAQRQAIKEYFRSVANTYYKTNENRALSEQSASILTTSDKKLTRAQKEKLFQEQLDEEEKGVTLSAFTTTNGLSESKMA